MLEEFHTFAAGLPPLFQVIAWFLPVLGPLALGCLALAVRGRWRVWTLVLGPAVLGSLCWALLPIVGRDGNMLAVALYAIYFVGLVVYYPVLILVLSGATWSTRRRRAAERA